MMMHDGHRTHQVFIIVQRGSVRGTKKLHRQALWSGWVAPPPHGCCVSIHHGDVPRVWTPSPIT